MPANSGAWQIVHFHVDTPSKPAFGAPCNGCGVCCLAEPCPVGILLSGRRTGTRVALRWSEQEARYRCGAVTEPASVLPPMLRRIAPLVFAPGAALDRCGEQLRFQRRDEAAAYAAACAWAGSKLVTKSSGTSGPHR